MRNYKCLTKNTFKSGAYSLIPLRDEDKYAIMQWRNQQLDILRQKQLLTEEQQEKYFASVVNDVPEPTTFPYSSMLYIVPLAVLLSLFPHSDILLFLNTICLSLAGAI